MIDEHFPPSWSADKIEGHKMGRAWAEARIEELEAQLVAPPPEDIARLIERLENVGTHLGNTVAGYRDDDFKRSARGLVDAATAARDAVTALRKLAQEYAGMKNTAETRHLIILDQQKQISMLEKQLDGSRKLSRRSLSALKSFQDEL